LEALGESVETLFLGGLDRGYDFGALVEKIKKSQIKYLVFFPESGETIAKMLGISRPAHGEDGCLEAINADGLTVLFTSSMQEAVEFAYKHTAPRKVCLLSTASPSYSVWKNFEEKGDLFQKWIKKLAFEEGFHMIG
jgi:UDP-N-acetylmuramoylalanine--D-glutamate ligase